MLNSSNNHYPYDASDLQTQIEYNGDNLPLYIGRARPQISTNKPEWQIKKMTYDGNGNLLTVRFAGGNNEYNYSWDERTSYTY